MLWLASGVIPWWFMRGSLNSGPTCINRYKYLVNRLKFPVALIPVFTQLSGFMFQIVLVLCLMVGYFASGGQLTIYFLQLPLIMLLMFVFFVGFSMLTSIVIDEFDGMFISIICFPSVWYYAVLAFVLFRIFDILKPFPISMLDKRVGGGLGVMLPAGGHPYHLCAVRNGERSYEHPSEY